MKTAEGSLGRKLQIPFRYIEDDVIFAVGLHRIKIPLACLLDCCNQQCSTRGTRACPRISISLAPPQPDDDEYGNTG
jgi:hypothetical protein